MLASLPSLFSVTVLCSLQLLRLHESLQHDAVSSLRELTELRLHPYSAVLGLGTALGALSRLALLHRSERWLERAPAGLRHGFQAGDARVAGCGSRNRPRSCRRSCRSCQTPWSSWTGLVAEGGRAGTQFESDDMPKCMKIMS